MMGYFTAVTLLARNDLKLALKDRSIILWLFIMPAAFFYFIGTVTQGGINFVDSAVELVVENNDGGFLSDHLESRLEENLFTIIHPQDIPPAVEGEKPVKYRRLAIPPDFTAQLISQQQVRIDYEGLREGFSNQYDLFRVQKAAFSVLGDLVVVKSAGQVMSPDTLAAATAGSRPVQLLVKPAGRQMQIPSGFEQAIPGTLVMFTLLVLLTSGAAMLVDDREKQLLRRLASAPLTRGQVVMGKWAGRMALATVQIAVAIGISFTPLFDMDWGQGLTDGGVDPVGMGCALYIAGPAAGQYRQNRQSGRQFRCFRYHDTGGTGWLLVANRGGTSMDATTAAIHTNRLDHGCTA